jgi:hypothetical protein
MDNLYKALNAWGIEPIIFLTFLVLSVTFLVVIIILFTSVPFILLRIRKELIELNKNLRTSYIPDSKAKSIAKTDAGDDNKLANQKKTSNASSKFQLDDDDIRKLKATGFDIE